MLRIEQQKITLTKGDSATIRFVPIYKDGSLYQTESGDRAVFRLREGRILIEIECSIDLLNNEILVDILPMHTINLKTGLHKYEVELLTGDGKNWTFIADQPFLIGNELEMHTTAPAESILLPPSNSHNIPTVVGEVEGEPPVVSGLVQEGRPSQDYDRLFNKPILNGVTIEGNKTSADYNFGTAADLDVAEEGDASAEQVVKGDDSRLSDARPASDVYDWAKQPTKPQYTKGDIGLGNVDNTSDAVKKADFTGYIAQGNTGFITGDEVKRALDYKLNITQKGAANGLAELDSNGKVPSSQLPSYVDGTTEGYLVDDTHFYKEDVDEAYYWEGNFYEDIGHTIPIVPRENVIYTDITTGTTFKWDAETSSYVRASRTLIPGEADKIYVDLYTNKTYRWSGTIFVEISASLALGETSSTAYRGDRGKVAYDHATETKLDAAVESGLYKVASTSEGHIASLTPVQKSDIIGIGIADKLNDLDDVNFTNLQDGQIPKYNATTQKWENANESGGTVQDAYKSIKVGDAVITASGEDTFELVAGNNVSLTPDVVNKKVTINSSGGGSGSGHIIENSSGTAMTQRPNMQFVDAQVEDDSTNSRTKIENVKVIQNESELTNLPDGIYVGSRDESIPFSFDAEDISYDNTTSHLEATDVQSAIDELSAKEAGVQSDWNEADNTKLDYIKNKPQNLVQDASYVHTDNNFTNSYKTAIDNLGTASTKDVPVSGDASNSEVVLGSDSRLSDARTPLSHTHTTSDITDFPNMSNYIQKSSTAGLVKNDGTIDMTSYQPTEAGKGLSTNDYTNEAKSAVNALGTASTKNVPVSGNAGNSEVVLGSDTRLTDARTPLSHTHLCSDITDLSAIPVADIEALFA